MTIFQPKTGYRYNSDTIFLYDFIANSLMNWAKKPLCALDVGCGCGILGLLLARDFAKFSVSALDIQEINCEIAKFNATQNGLNLDVVCANFAEFTDQRKFDLVVSNPPFYDFGSKSAQIHLNLSRYAQNLSLDALFGGVNSCISARGTFYFCYDARFLNKILIALEKYKFTLSKLRFVHSKIDRKSKLALFEAKKNSRASCEIIAPLVVFDGQNYTNEAQSAFKRASLDSADYE